MLTERLTQGLEDSFSARAEKRPRRRTTLPVNVSIDLVDFSDCGA